VVEVLRGIDRPFRGSQQQVRNIQVSDDEAAKAAHLTPYLPANWAIFFNEQLQSILRQSGRSCALVVDQPGVAPADGPCHVTTAADIPEAMVTPPSASR
jgi:hypothetical protein